MVDERDDGGPAFPIYVPATYISDQSGETQELDPACALPGMSLRDWLAGQIAAGLQAGRQAPLEDDYVAARAYSGADAMLKARKR